MYRSITVLFRRDAPRDRERDRLPFAGYRLHWPDGREAAAGLDAFCRYGRRLLGLDRHLAGASERLIEVLCFPVHDPEGPMTRLPGHRVRRFLLDRRGPRGRLHFLDGTPTRVDFVLGRDEASVAGWIGLAGAPDPARLYLDLAARPLGHALAGPAVPFAPAMPMERPPSSSLSPSSSATPPGFSLGPPAEEGHHTCATSSC